MQRAVTLYCLVVGFRPEPHEEDDYQTVSVGNFALCVRAELAPEGADELDALDGATPREHEMVLNSVLAEEAP